MTLDLNLGYWVDGVTSNWDKRDKNEGGEEAYEICFGWAESAHTQSRKAGQNPPPTSLSAYDTTTTHLPSLGPHMCKHISSYLGPHVHKQWFFFFN